MLAASRTSSGTRRGSSSAAPTGGASRRVEPSDLGLPERWILSRLHATIRNVDEAIERFDFAEAANAAYHFVWSEFCDWYVEMAKLGRQTRPEAVSYTLYTVMDSSLRLLHPMIPFVTEEIWQKLPKPAGSPASIMIAPWPSADAARSDDAAEREVETLQAIVAEIRKFRHDHKLPPRQAIEAVLKPDEAADGLLSSFSGELQALATLSEIRTGDQPDGWSRVVTGSTEIYLPLGDVVDVNAERARLSKEIAEISKRVAQAQSKLDNPKFVDGAPSDVVDKVRAQLTENSERAATLKAQLQELGS